MANTGFIGARVPRRDAAAKVTGLATYTDDLAFPGMLRGVVIRSPHPHARVLGIHVDAALKVPGVRAIVTPGECPGLESEVRYPGQKIAAVAAVDERSARRGAKMVKIEYEVLPAVFTIQEAITGEAPEIRPSRSDRYRNIYSERHYRRGDAETALETADLVVEHEYYVPPAHQAYMEPHCSIAHFRKDGFLQVWTGVQGQFGIRTELASLFDLPLYRVEINVPEIGGAFGGKTGMILEPIAAALSRKCGAPVKMRMGRDEELFDSHPGPGCLLRVRTGARDDGTLVAESAEIFYDTGAAPGAPAGNLDRTRGLYRISHFHYEIFSVFTNKIVPGAYRAPGALEMTYAFETQIDRIAEELEIDPIEFRLANAVERGDLTVGGVSYPPVGLRQTLEAARDYVETLAPRKGFGVGIASGKWMNAVGASSAVLTVDESGCVQIITGAVDLTGVNTVLAQVAADELGLPMEMVTVATRGTGAAPYSAISGGSRTTYGMTLAVRNGVERLKREIEGATARSLGIPAEGVRYDAGAVLAEGVAVPLDEIARQAMNSPSGPISTTGSASNETWLTDSHIFITQVAEMCLDEDTGMARVYRISSFQDVGHTMNPTLVEGQIEGGIVQGFGWGMLEGLDFHNGIVTNDGFIEYKVPTALDAPDPIAHPLEIPSPSGPYGLKGVGEPSMVAIPAAIANAFFQTTGRRAFSLPLVRSSAP